MAKDTKAGAMKEYFTSCLLAVGTSIASLLSAEGPSSRGLWIVGLAALFITAFIYFQFKRQQEDENETGPSSNSRSLRMAVLWYILTIALGAALVKDLVQTLSTAEPKAWLMSVLGLGVSIYAVTRLLALLKQSRKG